MCRLSCSSVRVSIPRKPPRSLHQHHCLPRRSYVHAWFMVEIRWILCIITASLLANFHRYQLSSTSVYNGDATAQDLAAHVFSCIFICPEIEPELFLNEEECRCFCFMPLTSMRCCLLNTFDLVPKLVVSSSFLSEHNYQLLVAVFHWLRYLSGSGKSVGDQKVGDIWVKCLKCIRQAISDYKPNDVRYACISKPCIIPASPCFFPLKGDA